MKIELVLSVLGTWVILQSILSSAIFWIMEYKNKEKLIKQKVIRFEEIYDTSNLYIYSTLGVLTFLSSLFVLKENILFLLGYIALTVSFNFFLIRIPLNSFKEIKSTIRVPKVTFKNPFYNIFSPILTMILGIILIIASSIFGKTF